MVKEEYLNPEFMYKMTNSLCEKNNWVLHGFSFGRLKYRGRMRPAELQNRQGYNMVYNIRICKMPEGVKFPACVREQDLEENILWREVCFDILNENIVVHNDAISNFCEFPKSFKLDNQKFYAVYGQPRVLSQHYSTARDCATRGKYMRTMGIRPQNLFDLKSLLCNVVEKNRQELFPLRFFFDSGRDATECISGLLEQSYDCSDFVRLDRVWSAYKIYNQDKDFFRLRIHNAKFPVFYTDNQDELQGGVDKVNRADVDENNSPLKLKKRNIAIFAARFKAMLDTEKKVAGR